MGDGVRQACGPGGGAEPPIAPSSNARPAGSAIKRKHARYRGCVGPRLDGQVVLITGAGSGIGHATALLASQEGASIAAIDVDEPSLMSTVERIRSVGGQIVARAADVAGQQELSGAVRALAAEVREFHGVFANAGVLPPPVPADELDWQEWSRVIDVNLTGAVVTLISALPHVREGGSLLANGSSMAIRPRAGRLAYVAAKAGLHTTAKALALELAERRIRVNVLAPGLTDTPMVRRIPGHIETGLASVPLGELVPAEEVAALAVYLLSDAAAAHHRRGVQHRRRANRGLSRSARRRTAPPPSRRGRGAELGIADHTEHDRAARLVASATKSAGQKRETPAAGGGFRERTTGFEPATPTLARLCSTS